MCLVTLHCLAGLFLTVVDSGTAKMLHCSFDPSECLHCKLTFETSLSPLLLGLWNLVFLFSNLSLVFLMPFAYFFTESEGFAGSKKVPVLVFPHNDSQLQDHIINWQYLWTCWSVLFCVGGYGTGVRSSSAAVAAGSACAGHCVGGISPPPRQHSQEEPLRWVTCIIDRSVTTGFTVCFKVAHTLWISDLWEYYLPYLYSGISLFGVLLLLCKYISITIN